MKTKNVKVSENTVQIVALINGQLYGGFVELDDRDYAQQSLGLFKAMLREIPVIKRGLLSESGTIDENNVDEVEGIYRNVNKQFIKMTREL